MSTIGVRELARHASSIINDIEQKKEPALVTRRGRPVVYMLPVDSEEFEDFVLAHAPQFVDGMAAADADCSTYSRRTSPPSPSRRTSTSRP
jgi:antitoxin (DNA-binding transcriptional repressor) of toxin-antitoxin stability system